MAYGVCGIALSLLGMVGTLLYQCYLYLKTGDWHAFPTTEACYRYLEFAWCGHPNDWIGLHKTLAAFNPAGAIFMISLAVLAVAIIFDEKQTV